MTRAFAPALIFAVAASVACIGPAEAADSRLVERAFDPAKVVKIEGRTNIQATIQFGESELIENVAIGDSGAWQVTPNKRANVLFVKPLESRAATNMTVVTNRHTYLFDLVASPSAKPLYVLRFTYPQDDRDAQAGALAAGGATADELAAATDQYAVVDPAQLNFRWQSKGDRKLFPERIYDDGNATFLTWPGDSAVPAILMANEEGLEGPVNYAVRGNTVVVEGVPGQLILRSGRASAMLVNQLPRTAPIARINAALPSHAETQ